jgi:hypothetical protein
MGFRDASGALLSDESRRRRYTRSLYRWRRGFFCDDLGARWLVALRAPVSPQVSGLGMGATGRGRGSMACRERLDVRGWGGRDDGWCSGGLEVLVYCWRHRLGGRSGACLSH